MRLPAIDDGAKVRWATLPDDLTGLVGYAVPLQRVVSDRARFVVAVLNATHGPTKALRHLSGTYKLPPSTVERLVNGVAKNLTEIERLDHAFQNAADRVRLAR